MDGTTTVSLLYIYYACVDGDIRLVGGGNEREGRVEVFYGGQWGTVCGDRWMDRASEVVCRQLDFFQLDKGNLK